MMDRKDCPICHGDSEVCGSLPGLRHCPVAMENFTPIDDVVEQFKAEGLITEEQLDEARAWWRGEECRVVDASCPFCGASGGDYSGIGIVEHPVALLQNRPEYPRDLHATANRTKGLYHGRYDGVTSFHAFGVNKTCGSNLNLYGVT